VEGAPSPSKADKNDITGQSVRGTRLADQEKKVKAPGQRVNGEVESGLRKAGMLTSRDRAPAKIHIAYYQDIESSCYSISQNRTNSRMTLTIRL
jgi:hypothetical protein